MIIHGSCVQLRRCLHYSSLPLIGLTVNGRPFLIVCCILCLLSRLSGYGLSSLCILLLPFCSPHLTLKKWPYYDELTDLILKKFREEYKIITVPGPNEIDDAKNLKAIPILENDKALNISQLTSIIKKSSFIIANDTGPAHIAAHVGAKGLTLFGKHTTAYKVSIERENFKPIQVEDLKKLSADRVFERLLETIS